MAQKMATVERVEELLEKLRAASWDHAVKGTTNQIPIVLPTGFFFCTVTGFFAFLRFFCIACIMYFFYQIVLLDTIIRSNISSLYSGFQRYGYYSFTT